MAVLMTLELEYVVRGYHEYKRVWTPNGILEVRVLGRRNVPISVKVALMSLVCPSSLGKRN